jgi:hypothetical protein
MNIKFHRLIVGSSGEQVFGVGTTWVIGGAIFLCTSSMTIFEHLNAVGFVLLLNLPMLVLFYLTYNFSKLRYFLGLFFGLLGCYFLLTALPDLLANTELSSKKGVYHFVIGFYYVGVAFFQYKAIKNSNKALQQD